MSSIIKPVLGSQLNLGHPLATGLVGCWLMNEGSGNKVFDSSENGNHGTITAATWTACKFGSGLNFSGTSQYVEIAANPTLRPSSVLSVVMWFNPTQFNNYQEYALSQRSEYAGSAYAFYGGNGTGNFYITKAADGTVLSPNSSISLINAWHQLVGVADGSFVRLYVDGIEQGSGTAYDGTIAATAGTEKLYIGSYETTTNELPGAIDHVMIFNRALSASEIALFYLHPFCMFERNPIELWSAATLGAPPVGMAGAMTTNTGYWGW